MKRGLNENEPETDSSSSKKEENDHYLTHYLFPHQVKETFSHMNCSDGMAATLAAKLFSKIYGFGEIKHSFLTHDQTDEDYLKMFEGEETRNIVIFDFSFNENVTKKLMESKHSIMIFDHHIGAKEVLSKFKNCLFDNDRAGAHLAWDYFFPGVPYPRWVDIIGKRDLGYNFEDEETRRFSSAIFYGTKLNVNAWFDLLYPNFDSVMILFQKMMIQAQSSSTLYEELDESKVLKLLFFKSLEDSVPYEEIKRKGAHYLVVQDSLIQSKVKTFIKTKFCGLLTAVGNISDSVSECGVSFLKNNPEYSLVLMWHLNSYEKKYKFSLRSRKEDTIENVDCSKIAKLFEGGGHKSAAGFQIDFSKNLKEFLENNINNVEWKTKKETMMEKN